MTDKPLTFILFHILEAEAVLSIVFDICLVTVIYDATCGYFWSFTNARKQKQSIPTDAIQTVVLFSLSKSV